MNSIRITALVALFVSLFAFSSPASADPLPGEVLKFQQLPLNVGAAPSTGGAPYAGHDEWSTAYADVDINGVLQGWRGTYAADDFGDLVSTPVVHIRWWGSYQNNLVNAGVQKFLVSFESDIPATTVAPIIPSHPGTPLANQIVNAGPLSPGSGTFNEKIINGAVPEHLYEYNAELTLGQEFFEQADQVYWLKIVALVDPSTEGMINWGWHNRDYTFQDTLASTTAPSSPGENLLGVAGGTYPVWHFQDDAVEGLLDINFNAASPGGLNVVQHTWQEQYYIDGVDGPASGVPGTVGIGQFSKDLAFELYTTPEPSTLVLLAMGAVGLVGGRWLRRQRSRVVATLAVLLTLVSFSATASADPLPGEVLKFQQLPLNVGAAPSTGGAPYAGHDEWSTAYADIDLNGVLQGWRGTYAADDFGDLVSTPVVHIRWWGSYQNNLANAGVQKFLVSFESDIPATTVAPIIPSHPGTPLANQIVNAGVLSPGSGTFTESLINGNVPEHLYEYNAELTLGQEFFEQADQVYWLKIVALVDPSTEGTINWGWHNRDYTFQDTLASTNPPSSPGENLLGFAGALPVWHFQDDAVEGLLDINFNAASPGGLNVVQHTWQEQYYIDNVDGPPSGIAGTVGIGQFSKDLAFELYTTPEPSTWVLLAMGGMGLCIGRRLGRRRRA